MKLLEKFNRYPILVFVVMLNDLKNIVMELLNIKSNIISTMNVDWWDFFIKLVIAILLWIVLKAYFKLKREMNEKLNEFSMVTNDKMLIFSIIMYKKGKDIIQSNFQNQNDFNAYLIKEYKETRTIVQNNFKDKSMNEIDALMIEYYPNEVRDAIIKK